MLKTRMYLPNSGQLGIISIYYLCIRIYLYLHNFYYIMPRNLQSTTILRFKYKSPTLESAEQGSNDHIFYITWFTAKSLH